MSLKKTKREFIFGDRVLEDLGHHLKPEEVMQMYARVYPSLTNGEVAGPIYEKGKEKYKLEGKGGGTERYQFSGKYGTKG